MSETNNNNNKSLKKPTLEEKVWFKSVRLTINLLINILIFFIVFVCCLFSWDWGISIYTLHIILCVIGFQFFMCHGTMIMSKYNSWSLFISRRYRINIHVILQLAGALLATIGTILIFILKDTHFDTAHGVLGLIALILSLLSLLNGWWAMYPTKLSCFTKVYWVKFFHYVTSIASIFLATASLCAAFKYESFVIWVAHDYGTPLIIAITWLFTILVSLERMLMMTDSIRNQLCN